MKLNYWKLIKYDFLAWVWALRKTPELRKRYEHDLFHQKLMKDSVKILKGNDDKKLKIYEGHPLRSDWYIGNIPNNWEEQIDRKIEQKGRTSND